jgi:hypothetical protein
LVVKERDGFFIKKAFFSPCGRYNEAVKADTFADGVQILVEEFGEDLIYKLPNLMEHYMRLREANGDEEVLVVRLFRKMMNRKKFCAAVHGAIQRRKRLEVLADTRDEMRAFLQPLGKTIQRLRGAWGGGRSCVEPQLDLRCFDEILFVRNKTTT